MLAMGLNVMEQFQKLQWSPIVSDECGGSHPPIKTVPTPDTTMPL
jgi:hypothetical protein